MPNTNVPNLVTPTYKKDKGVRINVPEKFAGKIMVVETAREYGLPKLCNMCRQVHTHKHYHLRIGKDGSVIVSQKIFSELTAANQIGEHSGLIVTNGVHAPPSQYYGARTHVQTQQTPKIKIKKIL